MTHRLSADGKRLFLAEITAHSVISTLDINGDLSSNFNVRHKIRDHDITEILKRAYETPLGSYARLLLLMQLQVFACAAYSIADNKEFLRSNKLQLQNMRVSPHFGGTIQLSTACVSEPMNLWFGLAKENQQNNQEVLDPHTIGIEIYGNVTCHVSLPSNGSPIEKSTQGASFLSAMSPQSPQVVLHGNYNNVRPQFARRLTPTSESLKKNIDAINRNYDLIGPQTLIDLMRNIKSLQDFHFVNGKLRDYRQMVIDSLISMRKLVSDTAVSGDAHYKDLLEQLVVRNTQSSDFYTVIKNARENWGVNRRDMLELLDHCRYICEQQNFQLVEQNNCWNYPTNFILQQNLVFN
jgi:hypothetical protein